MKNLSLKLKEDIFSEAVKGFIQNGQIKESLH